MRRRGITVVQLIIVILVALVIVGIVVPLVYQTRMAAARTQTVNNLKECALGVHAFHDIYRCLPDGFMAGGNYEKTPVSMWFHLLPFVNAKDADKNGTIDAIVPAFLAVGSSRVDLQACKLEYSIVSPK